VANLTSDQLRTRERVETLIRLLAPGLNVVLAVGERISRIVEPDDPEYYPARVEGQDRAAGITGSTRGSAQE
jgi:hypothetical protein